MDVTLHMHKAVRQLNNVEDSHLLT